jgi:hypothetical protein
MNQPSKPIAAVSLDLDNQWTYMKIHGDRGWQEYPSYLNTFLPHVLDVLKTLELKITFFIVGRDADEERNKACLREIVKRGHETGNHSYNHDSWLHTFARNKITREIITAEEAIENTTGQKPNGFRGPGFSWSPDLLKALQENNYLYDASTLPTYIGPLARMYYFWTADLTEEEKETRKGLFGSFKDGFRPLKPYYWQLNHRPLMEIPVTTIPVFKTPFHFSYLLYLSGKSFRLMDLYLDIALLMCRITKTQPSYLLHPLDLISGDQIPELKFFPGMDISSERKVEVFNHVIQKLSKHYQLVDMSTFFRHFQEKEAGQGNKLKTLEMV